MPPASSARELALAGLLSGLLAAWPLRGALAEGAIAGAGPDVVSTTWGMWWFSRTWDGAAWGGFTELVNLPNGAWGSVLSPGWALLFTLLLPVVGVGLAATLTAWAQLSLTGLALAWLARLAGARGLGVMAAALVPFVGRPFLYGTGEGSMVAVAVVPVIFGFGGLLGSSREGRAGLASAVLLGLCLPLVALDNPYLAPVLPGAAALVVGADLLARRWPQALRRGLALAAGSVAIVVVAGLFSRSASPDYPREVLGQTVGLAGIDWTVVDMPWAGAAPLELLWGGAPRWTLSPEDARAAGGGRTLGLGVLLVALSALVWRPRGGWPWLVLALSCVALSLGSLVGPVAGPFLFLNAVMDAVARPLTQPTRFLAVAVVGLGVVVGLQVGRLPRRAGALVLGLLGLEALVLGGASLRLPTTALPELSCVDSLPAGGVLTWPGDAVDGDESASKLLQLVHGRPAAHRGIASWRLGDPGAVTGALRGAGWRLDPQRPGVPRVNTKALGELGYRVALVDRQAAVQPELGEGRDCGGALVYELGP